ncbi:glycoside hydrolase family 2 TIM barrel-domain containing protein [Chitinophaga japonensis]|uniref:Putative secreted protein (Por secretion system target) n=1 Tax=Chitinophaga japonensis TaxID=104662 RepID=A0A562T4E5_CHIJA|nr:glycoside hydrolase family 2 TIM barrel-domain containing protein [Chitinophaga japonensis]TWI88243.1 putative secreted protein (Por secretion system target) [Chitinophaga japonensis]
MKKLILFLLLLAANAGSMAQAIKTTLRDSAGIYTLYRGGAPYTIKGAAANNFHVQVAGFGGNTIRTYGINDSTAAWLDTAYAHGISVCLGLYVRKQRELDYHDPAAVQAQFDSLEQQVLLFKDHPAVLLWSIGNEADAGYNNADTATNILFWDALNDIGEMIHARDTNHLTTTVLVNSEVNKVKLLKERFTALDILSINSYAPNVPGVLPNLQSAGWTKPYMITEFGPRGTWQMNPEPRRIMPWGGLVEQTSTEKAAIYRQVYQDHIAGNALNNCLGGFVFLWGYQSSGDVVTWYGLYNRLGETFAAADEMQYAWTGAYPSNRAPVIRNRDSLLFNNKRAEDTVIVEANSVNTAWVHASDPDNDPLRYEWLIIPENSAMAGGDPAASLPGVPGLILSQAADSMRFRAPAAAGNYRLYVYVHDPHGKVANAAIPFRVIPSATGTLITSTATGGNWSLPASWQGGVVPADADTVVILAGSSITINTPVKVACTRIAGTLGFNTNTSNTFSTGDLTVDSTGIFNAKNGTIGRTVTVNGNLVNNGAVDLSRAGATLIMGPAANSTLLGGTGTYAYGIIRSLTAGNPHGVILQTPVSIPSILTLADGVFHNGPYLTMDNTQVGFGAAVTYCEIRRTQHASLSDAYTLGSAAALYVRYHHDAGAPAQVITEGHELPVSRSLHSITVNNPEGVIIQDNLALRSINSALVLTDGILHLPADKTLVCTNPSYPGTPGSPHSFVEGAVALSAGATAVDRTFPVGSGGRRRKVVLSGVAAVSGAVAVRLSIHAAAGWPGMNMRSLSAARRWQCSVHSGELDSFSGIGIDYGTDDGDTQNRIAFSRKHHGVYHALPAGSSNDSTVYAATGSYGPGWYATGQDCSNLHTLTIAGIKAGIPGSKIALYPNPVTGNAIYIVCTPALKQTALATLLDMRGNAVHRWLLPPGQVNQELSFDKKPAGGVYLLVLKGAGVYRSFKVVIL